MGGCFQRPGHIGDPEDAPADRDRPRPGRRGAGAFAKLGRSFLAGTVGAGTQYISWLHSQDMNRIFLYAIERDEMEDIYNATGPNPATNAEFMFRLRRALGRFSIFADPPPDD